MAPFLAPGRPGRAGLVGTGLIGGSVGLALRSRGWQVTGTDRDQAMARLALELGALDATGIDPEADITFVATPVGAVPEAIRGALAAGLGVVTDVASVKASVVDGIDDPRFVGGHPMAGSEQLGVQGASADLFEGAVWVLTPVAGTDPDAYALVRSVVSSLGAEVLALAPDRHDDLVAMVSHVPHLTAASLMRLADRRASEHAALLRLAAGGFRDMTRVASGSPTIWPDICVDNRTAIVEVLDQLIGALEEVRDAVAKADRAGVLATLEQAQQARRNLPGRLSRPAELAELRVPVSDRLGVLAEVTTLATETGANFFDLEIAHSSEGDRGVLIAVVDASAAEGLRSALVERGYRPSVRPLG